MTFLYLIALMPIMVISVLKVFTVRVTYLEWLVSTVVSLSVAGIFHACVYYSMTDDVETWSGQVSSATYEPLYVERYLVAIYRTVVVSGLDSHGHMTLCTEEVFDHNETRYRTHPDKWSLHCVFGTTDDNRSTSQNLFEEVKGNFGSEVEVQRPNKPGFDHGDPNVYVVRNKTGYVYPLTMTKNWTNKARAAPSKFSFKHVSDSDTSTFTYPTNSNPFVSDRVMGEAKKTIDVHEWDRMNSRLGPIHRVNVIIIGFPANTTEDVAELQRSRWFGGKKNDLVLCYGAYASPERDPGEAEQIPKATWARVFGWTDRDDVKRNLEKVMLENPVDNTIIPKVEDEIVANYVIKDWNKLDYLTAEPPTWAYGVLVVAMILIQCLCVGYSLVNEDQAESTPWSAMRSTILSMLRLKIWPFN
jgi:hypothetical protein